MSLQGSMYTGISGIRAHSQAMSVIGNNLANTSTVGFKGARTAFEDAFYSTVNTGGGIGQVGHGTGIASIYGDFKQGPFEPSSEATNVAIGGEGFFKVRNPKTDQLFFTRAGNFVFNKEGVLTDPHGYAVQGWKVKEGSTNGEPNTVGSPVDIQLDRFQSPPLRTSELTMKLNLNSKATDKSDVPGSPFFSLHQMWNGTKNPPIAADRYAFQNTMKVFDESGTSHDLTIYFDPVKSDKVTSDAAGNRIFEYIVTVPPNEDGRTINGTTLKTSSAAGLLMTGTITFNPRGEMIGMSSFSLKGNATGSLKDLTNWVPSPMSENGRPIFTANFLGKNGASLPTSSNANPITLDFGMRNSSTPASWTNAATSNAAMVGSNLSSIPSFSSPERDASYSTSYDSGNTVNSQSQNGYGAGFLQAVEVNREGVVTGRYSNGQVLDLYVLTLASFNNQYGLRREGGNLFSATRDSGSALTGRAGTGPLGSIASNKLEQSNVDVGDEMVRMITTQRGFQANSKVITTADTLMGELIQLKR
ncbi:flagellar hook protein FlgE [Maridesulfovibrio sp. FT414]|uniref:flagellar hook protein FlgE n=1 Tax=Maridesulfovibrio sp. FT414 TaxID=2979469 RepID=UPI003D808BFE